MTDTCLICGQPVPEGRQVCPNCEKGLKPWKELSKTEVYMVKMKHCKGCEYLDHQDYCAYFDIEGHVRGCSSFDTAEMAKLIDGLISECKDAGIPDREIATPDEMRLLKEKYNIEL